MELLRFPILLALCFLLEHGSIKQIYKMAKQKFVSLFFAYLVRILYQTEFISFVDKRKVNVQVLPILL